MPNEPKSHLTIAETVALTGKSKTTVYRWIDEGNLRADGTSEGKSASRTQLLKVAGTVRGRPKGTALSRRYSACNNPGNPAL